LRGTQNRCGMQRPRRANMVLSSGLSTSASKGLRRGHVARSTAVSSGSPAPRQQRVRPSSVQLV
jgi:hypothetical protein